MDGRSVEDRDGYVREVIWIDPTLLPQNAAG
jgi:hypothetical protein